MDHQFGNDLWLILDRYLAGEASGSEAETVRDWLAADPSRAELLRDLRRLRDVLKQRPPSRGVDAAWATLSRELGIATKPNQPVPHHRGFASPARTWTSGRVAAAAAVILFAGGAATLWQLNRRDAGTQEAPPPRVYATQRAQRADLRLSDGTRVSLAPDSRLEVPHNFGRGSRIVTVQGEGNFDVVHDATKPFTVLAANAVVRDLGTRFDVRAYAQDADVRVVVSEGVVQLHHRDTTTARAATLERGALGRLNAAGKTSVVQGVDVDRYLAWTRGTLTFERTPAAEAIGDVSRWYDEDVRLGDPALATYQVTASLANESFTQAIQIIAEALDARVERLGSSYWILPKRAQR
jgi:transmembrane sensor